MTYGVYDGSTLLAKLVVPVTMVSNVPVFSSDALNLKRYTKRGSAQRWELTTNLEPLSYDAGALYAEIISKGSWDPFVISAPQSFGVMHRMTTTEVVTGTAGAGATQINISNNDGLIPAGCFVRFTNHSKVYMVRRDCSAASMDVFPPLLTAVNNTPFYYKKDVMLHASLSEETVKGMVYEDGILLDMGALTFVERL